MKSTIRIEFKNENYDKVSTILNLLQMEVERYDEKRNEGAGRGFRTVKGEPQ